MYLVNLVGWYWLNNKYSRQEAADCARLHRDLVEWGFESISRDLATKGIGDIEWGQYTRERLVDLAQSLSAAQKFRCRERDLLTDLVKFELSRAEASWRTTVTVI